MIIVGHHISNDKYLEDCPFNPGKKRDGKWKYRPHESRRVKNKVIKGVHTKKRRNKDELS